MLLFGIGDFFYFFVGLEMGDNLTAGLILIGITIAVAAVFLAVHRSISLGIAAGYVVMTIVSAGECTWAFVDPLESSSGGAFAGLLLYPAALVIVGIVAIVVTVRNKRRESG